MAQKIADEIIRGIWNNNSKDYAKYNGKWFLVSFCSPVNFSYVREVTESEYEKDIAPHNNSERAKYYPY